VASRGHTVVLLAAVAAAAMLGVPEHATDASSPSPAIAPPPLFDPAAQLLPGDELPPPPIVWQESRAIGKPWAGRLVRGVQLPFEGEHFFTWDPIEHRVPNRGWRRWGTDRLVRFILRVAAEYRAANPGAPRVAIGDLSRPHGGGFGPRFGGLGHVSHQNGLDVDVYYPRRDRLEREPFSPKQIDRRLAQDLVTRFVAHGAEKAFVGPRTGLHGRRGVVSTLIHHDDHVHVRIRNR
jgi:hypothetical protein